MDRIGVNGMVPSDGEGVRTALGRHGRIVLRKAMPILFFDPHPWSMHAQNSFPKPLDLNAAFETKDGVRPGARVVQAVWQHYE